MKALEALAGTVPSLTHPGACDTISDMRTSAARSSRSDLPRVLAELFRRLSDRERLELSRLLSWQEIEEWKATAETLGDERLMASVRRGLKDEARGRIRPTRLG